MNKSEESYESVKPVGEKNSENGGDHQNSEMKDESSMQHEPRANVNDNKFH